MWKGFLWIGIGIAMAVFDLAVKPMFTIQLTATFAFPLAVLAGAYGGLLLLNARLALDQAHLTEDEIATWGDKLERATPRLIALSEKQFSSGEIVDTVSKEAGIPQDILIKYMYAMRAYLQAKADEARAEERRGD